MSRYFWIALGVIAVGVFLWFSIGWDEAAPPDRTDAAVPPSLAPYRTLPRIELSPGTTTSDTSASTGLLTGTVRSSRSGAGIPAAQLHFEHAGRVTTLTTDEGGRFSFRPTEAGTHELLLVAADGYWSLDAGPAGHLAQFAARPGERLEGAVIELDPIRPVTVKVVEVSGKPISGASVAIDGEVAPGAATSGRTNGQGKLEIEARRGAVVRVSHEGAGSERAILDAAAERNGALTVQLAAGEAQQLVGGISGVVIGPDGAPIPFAPVVARSREAVERLAQVTADEAGRFRFTNLAFGSYDLVASLDGLAPAYAHDVQTGTNDVELTLVDGAAVTGKVSSNTGEPVVSFTVVATVKKGALERGAARAASYFDASGEYELRDLRPGMYVVKVYAGGWAPSDEKTVEIVVPAEAPARADFVLSSAGRVFGRVIEKESGAGIAGATVSVERALGTSGVSSRIFAKTTTGSDGSFDLRGVPPGRQSLVALAPGYDGRIVSGLEVDAEGSVGPITVELRVTPEGRESSLQYTGIGAVLSPKGDALEVKKAVAGGGAEAAGLGAGDLIVAVDGRAVTELGFEGSIHHIRGPVGSVVQLSVRRNGDLLEVDVERRAMN